MTESLERIQRRLASATDIQEIFSAMRAMAAVRLQEAQAALSGTRAYATTVSTALAEVMALDAIARPARPQVSALVVFTPEHGFVGALAERLVDRMIGRSGTGAVIVVGDRGADLAQNRGVVVHTRLSLGAHVDAGPTVARRAASVLETLFAQGQVDGVDVIFPRHTGAGAAELVERRLLPLEVNPLERVGTNLLFNLPVAELIDAVILEWIFGELAHAVVETLASENAARLLSMDGARRSVETKLIGLQGAYRIARQEAITTEIADVVGGVLAQE